MKTVKLPTHGTVFDYYLDHQSKRFLPWSDTVPQFQSETCTSPQVRSYKTAVTLRRRNAFEKLFKVLEQIITRRKITKNEQYGEIKNTCMPQ